jgi:hypothetical protein
MKINGWLNSGYVGGVPEETQIKLVNNGTFAVDFVLSNQAISIANHHKEWGDPPQEYHEIKYPYFPPADA